MQPAHPTARLLRTHLGRICLSVMAVLAGLALPSAALALAPMPVTGSLPANGGTIVSTTGRSPFELDVKGVLAKPIGATIYVEVSTQDVPGQDGTLADDDRQDFFALSQSGATPAAYRGRARDGLWQNPGTFYWQAQVGYIDDSTHTFVQQMSPVYTITVTAPPAIAPPAVAPPAVATPEVARSAHRMTLADLATNVPTTIHQHDRNARRVTRRCSRVSLQSFRCRVSWSDRVAGFAGTLRVTDDGNLRSTFSGFRETGACASRYSPNVAVDRCARPYLWRS